MIIIQVFLPMAQPASYQPKYSNDLYKIRAFLSGSMHDHNGNMPNSEFYSVYITKPKLEEILKDFAEQMPGVSRAWVDRWNREDDCRAVYNHDDAENPTAPYLLCYSPETRTLRTWGGGQGLFVLDGVLEYIKAYFADLEYSCDRRSHTWTGVNPAKLMPEKKT
jgi:hypothetical protein